MMNFGQPLTTEQIAAYLRTLPAIRERCGRVHVLAQQGKLEYFDYHPEKEADVAAFCIDIIKVGLYRNVVLLYRALIRSCCCPA